MNRMKNYNHKKCTKSGLNKLMTLHANEQNAVSHG